MLALNDTAPAAVQILSSGDAEAIATHLTMRGWNVGPVRSIRSGAPLRSTVVILQPDRDDQGHALEMCATLAKKAGPAILYLQPGQSAERSIEALDHGADDCLAAPHNPREVVARVYALLRRLTRSAAPRDVGLGATGARFDMINRRVTSMEGVTITLTERQARLLGVLVKHAGSWIDRDTLLDEVMGPDGETFQRAIDVHICRLKRKLAEAQLEHVISSSRGGGYRLDLYLSRNS